MALFVAIGVILSFIEFPLIPGIEFLKYDASAIPALLSGFTYGPVAGCIVGILIAVIHAADGNFWGAVMNSGIVTAFVLPVALIYKYVVKERMRKRLVREHPASDVTLKAPLNTPQGALQDTPQGVPQDAPQKPQKADWVSNVILIMGLVLSCALMLVTAIGMNLVITPIYMGVPREAVIGLVVPAIIPFNIVKAVINSVLGFVLFKSLGHFLK
jgi:riboflavin transporter FmnP